VEQSSFVLGTARAHHEASAKRELEAELRNASEIQRILFPERAPEMSGFDVVGRNIPAALVSGDYYDFFSVDAEHTGLAIADVCGKGIPASLITAMCRSVLRSSARENLSPAKVLGLVNRNLFPDIREDLFITGIYAVANNDGSGLVLARAGHTTPYLWRKATGAVEEISAPGVAIGFDKGDVFERITQDVSVPMAPGDVLLFYTDGVNEATDHKGLLFEEDRIKQTLAASAPSGAKAVVDALCNAVDQFMAGGPLSDDLTLVVIARK
jgi:sigma-B regulation protein RsbU (phosphoserine phosphatase)